MIRLALKAAGELLIFAGTLAVCLLWLGVLAAIL